jgi:hypothetical protein
VDGFDGVVPPPGTGGTVTGGSGLDPEVGVGVETGAAVTATAADALADPALLARALAVSRTFSPAVVFAPTKTVACSSLVWPTGRFPTSQTAPLLAAQTLNRAEPTCASREAVTLTDAFLLVARVLQTKIA